ncbi:L,D-transpeptidase family protein [Novosphingobium sp. KN65.2]|uniref:L,D-transpeptidase family protein n=1 Tax=Novosphingobium sp. KN65.2 TaxID=1478134 RepID=UPI0005E2C3B0|nr:L,D-transpeptidase family protein [Novosphingobium sp. KN65.2]CDO36240.1 putative peptidoglycan binding domain protein [Novosphingobium sp. KN65.2]
MRKSAIAASIMALAMALAGCGATSGDAGGQNAGSGQLSWSSSSERQLREALERRAVHGLDHVTFAADGASQAGEALTQEALRYARALALGATSPEELFEIYTIPRPRPDLLQGLIRALSDGHLDNWLEGLAPQSEAYRRLSKAYMELEAKKASPSPRIPLKDDPLEPGDSDPRIPAIARQLAASDYLDNPASAGNRYTPDMVRAVKRMQADYGIKPDGIIGKDALEILNLSDADRARALAVAMERLRWLERNPPATRIDVNTAAGRLTYWRDGKAVDTRKAVVGEPGKETPQLGSPIYRLVANPTWTVPRSIQEKEFADKGSNYLQTHNMAWQDGWIVQQSGPENSLGLVKFDMKNDHAIYLHDTPAKSLFQQVQRQRSHGCVRVQDALGFAELLARDEGVLDQWRKARARGDEAFVSLPREIPVRLLYQTVLFDAKGDPVVRADPYGWDDRVAVALGFGSAKSHLLRNATGDIGP